MLKQLLNRARQSEPSLRQRIADLHPASPSLISRSPRHEHRLGPSVPEEGSECLDLPRARRDRRMKKGPKSTHRINNNLSRDKRYRVEMLREIEIDNERGGSSWTGTRDRDAGRRNGTSSLSRGFCDFSEHQRLSVSMCADREKDPGPELRVPPRQEKRKRRWQFVSKSLAPFFYRACGLAFAPSTFPPPFPPPSMLTLAACFFPPDGPLFSLGFPIFSLAAVRPNPQQAEFSNNERANLSVSFWFVCPVGANTCIPFSPLILFLFRSFCLFAPGGLCGRITRLFALTPVALTIFAKL